MKCKAIQQLSKRYELGEVDILEKKLFEHHVKRCPVCNKKYKSLILMGALFAFSSKTYSPSIIKNFLSLTMVKITLVSLIFGGTAYSINKLGEKVKINETTPLITENKVENKIINEKSLPKDVIRIVAGDHDKTIEVDIDKNNFEIKNRISK